MTDSNLASHGPEAPVKPWRGAAWEYFLATGSVGVALGLRLALDSLWGDRLPYVTFFLAELLVLRFAGPGPFVFSCLSGFVLANWFFVAPRHSLFIDDRINQVNAIFFLMLSFVLLLLGLRTRRALFERKQAEAERERLLQELQTALANVKTLTGLLPICAGCKKIRDDQGSWNQIEFYIRERSHASFTHGICPDCAQRLYGDVLAANPR